jgi:hypothetical protein
MDQEMKRPQCDVTVQTPSTLSSVIDGDERKPTAPARSNPVTQELPPLRLKTLPPALPILDPRPAGDCRERDLFDTPPSGLSHESDVPVIDIHAVRELAGNEIPDAHGGPRWNANGVGFWRPIARREDGEEDPITRIGAPAQRQVEPPGDRRHPLRSPLGPPVGSRLDRHPEPEGVGDHGAIEPLKPMVFHHRFHRGLHEAEVLLRRTLRTRTLHMPRTGRQWLVLHKVPCALGPFEGNEPSRTAELLRGDVGWIPRAHLDPGLIFSHQHPADSNDPASSHHLAMTFEMAAASGYRLHGPHGRVQALGYPLHRSRRNQFRAGPYRREWQWDRTDIDGDRLILREIVGATDEIDPNLNGRGNRILHWKRPSFLRSLRHRRAGGTCCQKTGSEPQEFQGNLRVADSPFWFTTNRPPGRSPGGDSRAQARNDQPPAPSPVSGRGSPNSPSG